MSETVLDGVSVASGGTASGECAINEGADEAVIILDGDSNSTDVDLTVIEAAVAANGTLQTLNTQPSVTAVDATVDGNNTVSVLLETLTPYERLTIQFTNNAASATTITATQQDVA